MNEKQTWVLGVFVMIALATIVYIKYREKIQPSDNTANIVVTEMKRMDFKGFINSNIAWVPGEESVAALHSKTVRDNATDYTYHQEAIVSTFNLETGEVRDAYSLWDYGINGGHSIQFFWSKTGNRIINGEGSVAYLDAHTGHLNKELYNNYFWFDVFGISPDGKLYAASTGDILFVETGTGNYRKLDISPNVFSNPLHPLAWSPDGNWVAVGTYDPDHPPTPYPSSVLFPTPRPSSVPLPTLSFATVPPVRDEPIEALYLLRADGQEANLIAHNIKGRVDFVTFSPDTQRLIWVASDYEGNRSIYISNIDGSEAHSIFSDKGLPTAYKITRNVLWSEDGKRLVYLGL